MISVTKEFKMEAAHKLLNSYTEKCRNIHGHSYRIKVALFTSEKVFNLNDEGVVVDFTRVKDLFQKVVDMFDHSLILHEKDPIIPGIFKCLDLCERLQVYTMNKNPTAENLAAFFAQSLSEMVKRERNCLNKICIKSVTVYETKTSSAVVKGSGRHLEKIKLKKLLPHSSVQKVSV